MEEDVGPRTAQGIRITESVPLFLRNRAFVGIFVQIVVRCGVCCWCAWDWGNGYDGL